MSNRTSFASTSKRDRVQLCRRRMKSFCFGFFFLYSASTFAFAGAVPGTQIAVFVYTGLITLAQISLRTKFRRYLLARREPMLHNLSSELSDWIVRVFGATVWIMKWCRSAVGIAGLAHIESHTLTQYMAGTRTHRKRNGNACSQIDKPHIRNFMQASSSTPDTICSANEQMRKEIKYFNKWIVANDDENVCVAAMTTDDGIVCCCRTSTYEHAENMRQKFKFYSLGSWKFAKLSWNAFCQKWFAINL